MTKTEEKQMPPKSYYVLGSNWYCYVEPNENDFLLTKEDLMTELSTKALEAFLGERENDTLTVIDKEQEPMVGAIIAICEKHDEENNDKYYYQPSFLCFGNAGKYKSSFVAQKAYESFMEQVDKDLQAVKKIKKKKKG